MRLSQRAHRFILLPQARGMLGVLLVFCQIFSLVGLPLRVAFAASDSNLAVKLHWVASWSAAQQQLEPKNALPSTWWRDASLRQLVHVSLGGDQLRVRLSNAFGSTPLNIDGASIALAQAPGRADIDAASRRDLQFNGHPSVTIPAGAEYYSDPVNLHHSAGADLAVSLYFKEEPVHQTGHPGSRATSFLSRGQRLHDVAWPDAEKIVHWFQLADIEVLAPPAARVVVAIGDSITDGNGSTTNANNRWPDQFAGRLRQEGWLTLGVINAGIGGGRLLRDGAGPNLMARFDRDVLARSRVSHAIVLIGVNDLGVQHRNGDDQPEARKKMLDDLIAAHRQLVERAHAHGICMIGGTITPFSGSDYYRPNAANEADRQALNAWIRSAGVYDAVADFDAVLRDPAHTDRMSSLYDSGDQLHPSPAGYQAMANAIPINALQRCEFAH